MKDTRPDILTFTGLYFNFVDPDPATIRIVDIARGLSHACRFAGQCRTFYSVAQHCVKASLIVPPEDAYHALMHDAAEAYVGDMTRPLKQLVPQYKEIEDRVHVAIATRFGLPLEQPYSVKLADLTMLATEQRDLMPRHDDDWGCLTGIRPLPDKIEPWTAARAFTEFLTRFFDVAPHDIKLTAAGV